MDGLSDREVFGWLGSPGLCTEVLPRCCSILASERGGVSSTDDTLWANASTVAWSFSTFSTSSFSWSTVAYVVLCGTCALSEVDISVSACSSAQEMRLTFPLSSPSRPIVALKLCSCASTSFLGLRECWWIFVHYFICNSLVTKATKECVGCKLVL